MRPEQGITLYPHLTQEFLRAAIAEGAHKRRSPRVSESVWVRQKNMLGISVGTGRATYKKLGEVYKVTPSRIGQINTQAYTNLWRVSSDQLKESFPLASLNLRRSKPPDRLPWQEPIRILSKIEQLAKRLPHAKTDEEVQAVLNQVSRHDLMVDRRRKDRLLLPVTDLIGIGHFHFPKGKMRPFLTALENAGIPRVDIPLEVSVKRGVEERTVTRHYRIIAARHEDRALTALLEDPNLQKFSTDPLVQVCGPKVKEMPKTWRLAQQIEFNALTPLFLELGIGTMRHPKYELADLLTQTCPVPIYCYRRRYFYPNADEGQLKEFLGERRKSIERQELLQLLRQVAEKGEDTGVISPIELYQHGFIAKAQLRRQTTSLADYLQTNSVRLDERLYPSLYAILSAKNPSMIIDLNTIGRGKYRVYRYLTDQDKEEIAILLLINELKKGQFPMRTIEQQQMYQQKLLRRKDNQGNLVVISFNDAFTLLMQRLHSMVYSQQYKNRPIINDDDVVDNVLARIYSYLLGERGDFENFDKFLSFVFGTVKITFFEQLRKRRLEQRRWERVVSEDQFGSGRQQEQSLQVEKAKSRGSIGQLSNLPPERAAILRLKLMGIHVKTIAEIFGRHESTIRSIISTSLDHINPGREKRKMPTVPFNPDTALLGYQKLRELTLKTGGRLPTGHDLNKAFKQGKVDFSEVRYRRYFGQGSWGKAREELERLLASTT